MGIPHAFLQLAWWRQAGGWRRAGGHAAWLTQGGRFGQSQLASPPHAARPTGVDVWGGQPGHVVATGGLQGGGRPGMTGGRMGLREEMPASRWRAVGRIGR